MLDPMTQKLSDAMSKLSTNENRNSMGLGRPPPSYTPLHRPTPFSAPWHRQSPMPPPGHNPSAPRWPDQPQKKKSWKIPYLRRMADGNGGAATVWMVDGGGDCGDELTGGKRGESSEREREEGRGESSAREERRGERGEGNRFRAKEHRVDMH